MDTFITLVPTNNSRVLAQFNNDNDTRVKCVMSSSR